MIKLQAKIFELNFLSKFSDLKSNFTLTLGYLNPPLNNRGQDIKYLLFPSVYRAIDIVFTKILNFLLKI